MSAQPEALRLADALRFEVETYPQVSEDEPGGYATYVDQLMDEAAAELRRLHAEKEAKNALLRQAVEALEKYDTPAQRLDGSPCREPIEKRLCAAIRQHLGQKGETK